MQRPLKIIFDASPLLVNKTGVAYYTERLITHLAKEYPQDIELVGFYYNFLGRRSVSHFPKAPNIRYRPVRLLPSKVLYQLRRWGIEIPLEVLTKEKGDFVLFPNFLGWPSLFHAPAAPVIHDLTYVDLPQYVSAKNGSDLRQFVPKQLKRSCFAVTVSNFSREGIIKNYGLEADDVIVTHIPPETPHFKKQDDLRTLLRSQGIDKPYILFIGTIEPRKNIPRLIDAYARLPETTRQKYSLVIVGRIGWNCDKEVERLKDAREQELDVRHVGYVDDKTKEALFQGATLFVHASEYEGFGMPVLEAMSYGVPCCISDIPVFREVIEDAAVYFDCREIGSIANSLEKTLRSNALLKKLHGKSLEQAAKFNWEEAAAALYDRIIKETGRA
ncbi:MAG TPA: glycosyltransferase family 1 protein [Candidatus Saccharimonadales bacterium]|nr:glycosyltransferase family 1 protein [Candidatus Saccharimonadales bacterium]